ncbi:hypothetical protein R1sor_003462 [Riccia sorocarpa]|uniref:Uncharacterized protein n=1 Tax=Riccia sorocarpa TaxID=122646 RepID=A0ABD3H1N3_9MARC
MNIRDEDCRTLMLPPVLASQFSGAAKRAFPVDGNWASAWAGPALEVQVDLSFLFSVCPTPTFPICLQLSFYPLRIYIFEGLVTVVSRPNRPAGISFPKVLKSWAAEDISDTAIRMSEVRFLVLEKCAGDSQKVCLHLEFDMLLKQVVGYYHQTNEDRLASDTDDVA